MGRFLSTYNPEVALHICEQIAEGATLSSLCKTAGNGIPTRQTFHRWVVQYPELSRAYSAARELSAHSLEEEALDAARTLKDRKSKLSAQEIRAFDVAMNQLRWSAARRNPRVYSERGAVTITVPIQINTSLDLGSAKTLDNVYTLQATNVEELPAEQVDHAAEMQRETPVLVPMSARKQRMKEAREKHGEITLENYKERGADGP